jgi:hypothetical protein
MAVEVRKCTHIKVNGIKCGSPALKISDRCYFHDQAFRRLRTSVLQKPAVFPVLEDANSIQVAIMDIMNDLRYDHIDQKLAGKLLYALQIASYNLKRMDLDRQDTIQDLPADWHPIEPKNLPRWGYVKMPYDGEPDPTLPNFSAPPAPPPAELSSAPSTAPPSQTSTAPSTAPPSQTSTAPSTVPPASRRQSLSTNATIPSDNILATHEHHPERECAPKREALGATELKDLVSAVSHSTPPRRPSKSSSRNSIPSLPAIEQKIARAKAGNVGAVRELFQLAGLMPRQ